MTAAGGGGQGGGAVGRVGGGGGGLLSSSKQAVFHLSPLIVHTSPAHQGRCLIYGVRFYFQVICFHLDLNKRLNLSH